MNKNLLKATLFLFAFTLVGIAASAQPVQTDDSQANFTAGSGDANIVITNTTGGEVGLAAPSGTTTFNGGLPAGWTSTQWVGSGYVDFTLPPLVFIDAATMYTSGNPYTKGTMMQFTAKFESASGAYQFMGFSSNSNLADDVIGVGRGNTNPAGDANVYTRISGIGDIALGAYADNYHVYTIAWNLDDTVKIYVDGVQKAAVYQTFTAANFKAQVSDLNAAGGRVWVQDMSIASGEGIFTSRVFDEGFKIGWSAARWQATTPSGTTMDVLIRAGDTPTPDGSWSAWTLLPGNTTYLGAALPGRYVQYQLVYSSNDATNASPNLEWIQLISSYLTPVTMTDLRAQGVGNDVKLEWGTASEQNNKGFQIQRSQDQVKWANLGFVEGAGTVSTPKTYAYSDLGLNAGKYFYRLVQTDYDGKTALSNTVSATITKNLLFTLGQSYPNPSNTNSIITYSIPQPTRVRIMMYDASGRIVKVVEDAQRAAGSYTISVDQSMMTGGVYIYKMEAGSYHATKKMVIQK